jgi:hypothetical protein
MRIQKAILEGHLKIDNKMKLDGNPFPQNMVGFSVNMVTSEEKGKVKVLTSARAKQDGSVDPAVVWTSLGPLPRWVPGPTTRWAPGIT